MKTIMLQKNHPGVAIVVCNNDDMAMAAARAARSSTPCSMGYQAVELL